MNQTTGGQPFLATERRREKTSIIIITMLGISTWYGCKWFAFQSALTTYLPVEKMGEQGSVSIDILPTCMWVVENDVVEVLRGLWS